MDFLDILKKVKEGGAFKDYDPPLSTLSLEDVKAEIAAAVLPETPNPAYGDGDLEMAKKQLGMELRIPAYPGDQVLRFAAPVITGLGVHIPQELMDAQGKAFFDAIRLYMPDPDMLKWVGHYFGGDFLASEGFHTLAKAITYRDPNSPRIDRATLDNELSFKLDDERRVVRDRRVFTKDEIAEAIHFSKNDPSLMMAVIAFQSLFMQYMNEFANAVEHSDGILNEQERQRAGKFAANLKRQYMTDNFVGNMLPAIVIHHRAHDSEYKEPFTLDDFSKGLHFINMNGSFRHDVETPDGQAKVKLACPFQQMIYKTSRISKEGHPHAAEGTTIYNVYLAVKEALAKENPAALGAADMFIAKAYTMLETMETGTKPSGSAPPSLHGVTPASSALPNLGQMPKLSNKSSELSQ